MDENISQPVEILNQLPTEYPESLISTIQKEWRKLHKTIIVLDDDPTGTQTVSGVPVLTDWHTDTLTDELGSGTSLFYILTNSRSYPTQEAIRIASEIGRNLKQASARTGRNFQIISRGDSTLRGHYPDEVTALQETIGIENPLHLLIPAFFEGGRYTIDDIHYVKEDDLLMPAAVTPFARDKSFGYTHSDLKLYVEEKTRGSIPASEVCSLSISDVRTGPDHVAGKLRNCRPGQVCIVNAASYRDLEVAALGFIRSGREAMLRTAASFVPVLAGMSKRPFLTSQNFRGNMGGVLIIVGSYVPKTTSQLGHLFEEKGLHKVEVDVESVLTQGSIYLEEIVTDVNSILSNMGDVVVYTSRELIAFDDPVKSLETGKKVSDFMTEIVQNIDQWPSTILAKGGITSSDTATRGLGVKRALVLGQVAAGVPVWKLGPETRFPGLRYVVFPGNVGDDDTLRQVYRTAKGLGFE